MEKLGDQISLLGNERIQLQCDCTSKRQFISLKGHYEFSPIVTIFGSLRSLRQSGNFRSGVLIWH